MLPLQDAAHKGDVKLVAEVLETVSNINEPDPDGKTALHVACGWGYCDVIEFLLDHGADIKAVTKRGNTPLHMVAYSGYAQCARVLMRHGADPKATDVQGQTPIAVAKKLGHESVDRAIAQELGQTYVRIKRIGFDGKEVGGCNCKSHSAITG